MIDRPRDHVLVCVRADGTAQALLTHAHHLATALGSSWTVLCLDKASANAAEDKTPGANDNTDLRGALAAAVRAGAHVDTSGAIPGGRGLQRQALADALTARVLELAATAILIGPQPLAALRPRVLAQRISRALPGLSVHVFDPSEASRQEGSPVAQPKLMGALVALAVLASCTAVAWLLAPQLTPPNLIMVYLAGVVFIALRTGRPVALLSVIASVALYDLLFIQSGDGLNPSEPHYVLVSAVMLLVGFIVSHLASLSRQQTAMAEFRAQRAHALNHLALELVKARTPESIGSALAVTVHRSLGSSAHLLPLDAQGQFSIASDAFPPQARLAAAALERSRATGAGTDLEPDAPYRCIPMRTADGALGVVAIDLLAREHDTSEDREFLWACANQAAVALERAVFEQRSARDAVQAESERLRNTLLAGVSHDFRTPLTTIIGTASSLLEQGHAIDTAQRTSLLKSLLAEARRMHALSSNMLDLTRMEEGGMRLQLEWCPADELVEEARAALGSRLAEHAVSVQTPTDAVVWCDPRLIGQLLVNLLDNATRYAPGAALTITITVNVESWQLTVQDEGPGIPAGQENEVFKKFYRKGVDSGAASGGTGLGLAICAAVAHLHGGTLVARPGRGACFVLTLPQPSPQRPWEAAGPSEAE